MEEFIINYYDADHSGTYTNLTKQENFSGSYKNACIYAHSQKSPWGFFYKISTQKKHGYAIITETTLKAIILEKKIAVFEKKIAVLEKELKKIT